MRILHVIPSTDPTTGGPIEAIRQASLTLNKMGHANEIACLDPPDSSWLTNAGVPVYPLGPAVGMKYRFSRRLVPWLREHSLDYDCVIVHGLWSFATIGARLALYRSQVPYFVYAHGMLDPVFRRLFPWKHAKKSLYWKLVEHQALCHARAVLFTCEEERTLASGSFWPHRWQSAIVPYCVNAPQDCPEDQADAFLRKYPELREKRLFLFLSRIHAKKGCDLLVEAFAGAARTDPAVHLVMAGPSDPPEWAETLKARADELGIGHRITWTGMLKGHDKWSAFRAAEVFILPTHQENFGIAITEALGCGTPVLITHGVNIWREIESDAAGIVAPPGAEGTRQLLERWLALGASARQAMRRSAACCFAKRFDSEHAAAVLIDTLKKHGVG